jgi:RNA polymerase sigma factor (sigma-70 family)
MEPNDRGPADDSASRTGATLFDLLDDPSDPRAWSRFVDRYGKKVYAWSRRWGFQEADVEDVMQAVLTKIFLAFTGGKYRRGEGKFRGWLQRVVKNVCHDVWDRRRRGEVGAGDPEVQELVALAEAADDLGEKIRREHDREVLQAALVLLRARVSARDWEIYEALALRGRAPAEVAAAHGLRVEAGAEVKSRAKKKLMEEVRRLDPDLAAAGSP